MDTGTVIRNDYVWQGHPDVALFNEQIFVVYRQSDSHKTASETKIQLTRSPQDEISFSEPTTLAVSEDRYNCPRLCVLDDVLYVVCDKVAASQDFIGAENRTLGTTICLWRTHNGETWEGPLETNVTGIVPDRIIKTHDGRYLLATHTKSYLPAWSKGEELLEIEEEIDKDAFIRRWGYLIQSVWISSNPEGPWGQYVLGSQEGLNFCEASIFVFDGASKFQYVAMMRENSGLGHPSFYCVSRDGQLWSKPKPTRMFGCHRPVCGVLRSGYVLTTYREASHIFSHGYWAKNTFACLSSPGEVRNNFRKSIILPLDHDRSKKSDGGYTGWIQLPDTSIFVVNYITDDAPKPYIKWYRFTQDYF